MNVEIKRAPSAGLGRSIQVDLSTYAKGKIDSVREMRLEETNVPLRCLSTCPIHCRSGYMFTILE